MFAKDPQELASLDISNNVQGLIIQSTQKIQLDLLQSDIYYLVKMFVQQFKS